MKGRSDERGMVTAEAAVVLPILAAFVLVLVWLLSIGIAQVQVVDAARDGARAVARGVDTDTAVSAARRAAPDGAQVDVVDHGKTITVTVSVDAHAPGWLLVPMPDVTVDSASTMEVEGVVDSG